MLFVIVHPSMLSELLAFVFSRIVASAMRFVFGFYSRGRWLESAECVDVNASFDKSGPALCRFDILLFHAWVKM